MKAPSALKRRGAALAAAIAVVLCATHADAAQVRGRIVNTDTGKPAAGAQVKIQGSSATATTDADGRFTLDNLPAGPVTLVVSGGGLREQRTPATASDDTAVAEIRLRTAETERIVVTGIRAAELAAVAAKREADTQVEVVTSDEVGKLVDKNVADAVARLPGVTTATDKGEGRYVVIRGLEPALANVTINNQTSASPEPESRQVKLDDVPAALIGEVTVVKVLTADRDANAIAGQVDIKTLSAFDRGKNFASVRLAGVKGSIHDQKGQEGDITVGGTFGDKKQFGAVLAYNRSKRPSDSDDVIYTGDVAWQTISGIDVPISMDGRVYEPAFRTREGVVANLDWQVNANVHAYARLTGSKFDDEETRERFRFLFPTAASGYSNLTAAGGNITGARGERYLRLREEITETRTATVGGEFKFGKDTLTAEASSTKATKKDPQRAEFRYRTGATTITGSFGLTEDFYSLNLSPLAYDASRYLLNTFRDQSRYAQEELSQVRADYQMAFDSWGTNSYLKFGGKYLDRDKVNDQFGRSWTYTGPNYALTNQSFAVIDSFYDGRYVFGPTVNFPGTRAFFAANPTLFTLDRAGTLADSLAADYGAREKIAAAYVMASINRGALVITPGLRVERTEADYKAIAITDRTTETDVYNTFGSRSYTDWFPSLAGRLDFDKNLVGRASVTTAIGRPDYDKVVPTVSVDVAGNAVTAGNPNLEALKAVNFDASLEYYFPSGGILAAAVFHKKIDNPIFVSTRTVTGIFAGIPLTNAIVTQPLNGDTTKLTGIEINLQKPFTFLPAPFDGFGGSLNATFVKGETTVPGRSDKIPPPQQADRILSAQLYFEKWGFSSRLAYTWRSEVLELVGANARNDIYNGKNGVMSLKLAYEFTKQLSIFFEGSNLTNEQDYRYAATSNRMVEAETFGRIYRAGLTWSY